MFKILERIADALEEGNKQKSQFNNITCWIDSSNKIMEKYLPAIDLLYSYTGENGSWTLSIDDMQFDKCYFSGKICTSTDKERKELIIIDSEGKTTHSQALKPFIPKNSTSHFDRYVILEDKVVSST